MGERGLSTPQVHQLRAVGKSCLRNEGKRPGRGLCCDILERLSAKVVPKLGLFLSVAFFVL